MSELPEGWAEITLGEAGEWRGGGTPSKANPLFWSNGDIPWVSPKDMKSDLIADAEDHITPGAVAGSATQLIPEGSVLLVTRSGILRHTLPVGLTTRQVAINQDLKALTPNDAVNPEFVSHQIRSSGRAILSTCAKSGTTVDSIDFERLKATKLPLPPLPEQRRIVAKTDSLTGKSRRARDHLDHIPRLVEKYKQAVLAAAFRGDLTGSAILAPRSELRSIASRITKGASPKWQGFEYQPEGVLFVRSQNVGWGELLLEGRAYLPTAFNLKQRNSIIAENDVLLNIVGASIGRSAVASVELAGANCNQAVSVIRLAEPNYHDARYLNLWLQTDEAQNKITFGSVDVARANFSLGSIGELKVPWPSERMRQQIVGSIERAFGWIDRLASDATSARRLIDRLDQAVFAKAFRGELVPQDPADEPASVLLERMNADRHAAPKAARGRKGKVA